MPTKVEGDYSRFPSSIRGAFPYLQGEACKLRQALEVYSHLFTQEADRTEFLSKRFGALLVVFQNLLQDELFLAVTRFTDRDRDSLALHALLSAIPSAEDPAFEANVSATLHAIEEDVTPRVTWGSKAAFKLTVKSKCAMRLFLCRPTCPDFDAWPFAIKAANGGMQTMTRM